MARQIGACQDKGYRQTFLFKQVLKIRDAFGDVIESCGGNLVWADLDKRNHEHRDIKIRESYELQNGIVNLHASSSWLNPKYILLYAQLLVGGSPDLWSIPESPLVKRIKETIGRLGMRLDEDTIITRDGERRLDRPDLKTEEPVHRPYFDN